MLLDASTLSAPLPSSKNRTGADFATGSLDHKMGGKQITKSAADLIMRSPVIGRTVEMANHQWMARGFADGAWNPRSASVTRHHSGALTQLIGPAPLEGNVRTSGRPPPRQGQAADNLARRLLRRPKMLP